MGIFNRKGPASQPIAPVSIQLMVTADGVMITQAHPDGRFSSFPVKFGDFVGANGAWAVGRGIDLDVRDQEGAQALILRFRGEEGEHVVFQSSQPHEVAHVSVLVRNAWMQANAGAVPAAAPVATQPVHAPMGMAMASAGATYTPSLSAQAVGEVSGSGQGKRRWLMWTACVVGVLVLGWGSWAAASRFLKPSGPGIDLSSMSIEEVASMEANPAAIQGVQDAMIEAMTYGRTKGAEQAAGMESETIKTLESMGLVMGASMKNAMGCLAK